jgi:putative flippase GtrA
MKLIKYFFVGGVSAVIDFIFFSLLIYYFNLAWHIAGCVSFLIATTTNYFLSIQFVFNRGSRFKQSVELTLIYLVSGIGLALNLSFLYVFIEIFDLHPLISKIMATGAVFFWNFSLRQFFIFRTKRN